MIGALQARLDSVEKRAGVEARFLIEGNLGSLPPALEEALFRIAQEALNNALKHAAARSVVVRLRGDDECVTLEVTDDGRGSALLATDVQGGLGLTSMRERVAQLAGTLTIESRRARARASPSKCRDQSSIVEREHPIGGLRDRTHSYSHRR